MNKEQWIAEAEKRIEQDKETIDEWNHASSCDYQYWHHIKDAGERAVENIKFLQVGIAFLKGSNG
jgi:hypothetical protein